MEPIHIQFTLFSAFYSPLIATMSGGFLAEEGFEPTWSVAPPGVSAIEALKALSEPCRVRLTTDSTYVKDGITQWLANWKRNGWKTAAKKPVKNQDLWQALDHESARHEIDWCWVKGHSGHPENERADRLANLGMSEVRDTDG